MLAGALQERSIWVVPLAVAVSPVGAPGTVVAVTLAASVPRVTPSEPERAATVRVKVSSVFAASAGIVTTGVALPASSNVTVTPLDGLVSAQE